MIQSRSWLIACVYVLGLAGGTLLLIQHWVHIPAMLPFLIFLACPLMHIFMHGGHGAHHEHLDVGKQAHEPDGRIP